MINTAPPSPYETSARNSKATTLAALAACIAQDKAGAHSAPMLRSGPHRKAVVGQTRTGGRCSGIVGSRGATASVQM